MTNFTCHSKSFINIFSTCQVSACEQQPFSCHNLANDVYSETAKTVFSHLNYSENGENSVHSEKKQKVATADNVLQLFQDFDYLLFDIGWMLNCGATVIQLQKIFVCNLLQRFGFLVCPLFIHAYPFLEALCFCVSMIILCVSMNVNDTITKCN